MIHPACVRARQELIIQNFVPKRGTAMAAAREPPFGELLWTVAVARLLFGPAMNIQAPPNLTPGAHFPSAVLGQGVQVSGFIPRHCPTSRQVPAFPRHIGPQQPARQVQGSSGRE